MDIKLVLCVVIFIIFILIVYLPIVNKNKQIKEPFVSRYYPNKQMEEHTNFINNQSNVYNQILTEINDIATAVASKERLQGSDRAIPQGTQRTHVIRALLQSIYDVSLTRFSALSNCSDYSAKCRLYKHIYRMFRETPAYNLNTPKHGGNMDYINLPNTISTELKRNYIDLKDRIEQIITKNIISLGTTSSIPQFLGYTKEKRFKIIERTVSTILFDSYFEIYPSSQNTLACSLYTNNNCPIIPFNTGEDSGDPELTSAALPEEILKRYKCKLDSTSFSNSMTPLCVNNENNRMSTTECSMLNGYGKEMCINTIYNNNPNNRCEYENLTQRCVNPGGTALNAADINSPNSQSVNGDAQNNKCHLIYNSDLSEMERICNAQSSCTFLRATDRGGKERGLCYGPNPSQPAEVPNNFCLSLSNLRTSGRSDITNLANARNCDLNLDAQQISRISKRNGLRDIDIKCEAIDESHQKIDNQSNRVDKASRDKDVPTVLGNENQKQLCNSLMNQDGDEQRCKYIEYTKYIPKDHNSKYEKIGMCIPNNNNFNLNVDLINNQNDCRDTQGNLMWSADPNNICVDLSSSCNNLKYKNLCNYKDNCLWQATPTDETFDENYEMGYCRDLTSSLDKIEDLIDNIHSKHVANVVKTSNIEHSISNIIPKFKNKIASLSTFKK